MALERYSDAAFMRDNDPLYFGNDGDASLQYNTTPGKVVAAGTWNFSDATVAMPPPSLRVATHECDHSDWSTGASGAASDATAATILLSDISIPANSVVLGVQVAISDKFAGSAHIDSIGMSIGPAANSDAWSGGVSDLNVYQEATRVGALSQSGTPSFTTAATIPEANLNYNAGLQSDFNGGTGHATISVAYMKF